MSRAPHLEALYALFARYPFRVSRYCDHCFDAEEVAALKKVPLRERELDGVLCSLLGTFGDENDVKHLAPRLLELYGPDRAFERELVQRLLRQAELSPAEELGLRAFFVEEALLRFQSSSPAPVLEPAARLWLQPQLAADLARAVNAPRWYAHLICEVGSRHGQRAGVPFDAWEQPLVDWLFSTARADLLERAFFCAPREEDQRLFSLALQVLEFWT
jgi:hypothetical protein